MYNPKITYFLTNKFYQFLCIKWRFIMILEKLSLRTPFFGLILLLSLGICVQSGFASTIGGFVYDKQRNALPEVDVELQNEYYQTIRREKTNGVGRYEFAGLGDGNYTVKALPFRYDLEDQAWPIEINTFGVRGAGVGNAYMTQDFYLLPKRGGIADAEVGVIFAQEIPTEAKNLFRQAVKDLTEKRTQEGVEALYKALQIFPEYYDALYRMGKELYVAGKYGEAWQYLLKSTEVNPKSGPSYYYMGYSFFKLGKDYYKAAITSLTRATELIPNSMRVVFALGMVERAAGKFEDAEKHLLQAKRLADGPVPEIHKELAQLYGNDMKKYKEAADELELYMKASKLNDQDQKATRALIQSLREKARTQS